MRISFLKASPPGWEPPLVIIEHIIIESRRLDFVMALELLGRSDILASFKQMAGKEMPEVAARGMFYLSRSGDGQLQSFLWKHPFPRPFRRGIEILAVGGRIG